MVFGATFVGVLMVLFLWRHVPSFDLTFWLSLIFLSAALRVLAFRRYHKAPDKSHKLRYWGRLFYGGSLIAGSVWSVLPVLFYNQIEPHYLLLISTVFAGMVSVTAAAGSIYLPSFYAFAVPLVIPVSFMHLFSGVDYLAITGVMLLLYLAVSSFLAQRGHRQYIELVKARFANNDLMQQLNEEKVTAERAVEVKTQFMAAASHDLRQPLHALGMFIGSLRKRDSDTERLQIIRDMEASTQSLSQLLHSMLDLSKLQANIVSADIKATALNPILVNLRSEFEPLARAKSLQLFIPKTDIVVKTDGLLLSRVLRNLLTNAINYTEKGHVSLELCQRANNYCELKVIDSGLGIEPAMHSKVFEDYVRAPHSGSNQKGGLGLGLAIVRRYCQLLDITLKLESAPQFGTTLTLTLDCTDAPVPAIATSTQVNREYSSTGCVLVVDDDQNVTLSMHKLLESWGCNVICAESAQSALFQLAQWDALPDLVLCDFQLGGDENGLDVVQVIHEGLSNSIPAIIITGDTSPTTLEQVEDAGLDILYKPVAEDELKRALTKYLD